MRLDIIKRHNKLVSNFSYLSLLQVFQLIVPLIIYPFLIRKLGSDVYGKIIYAQSIISFFILFINFGLNVYATKEVSIYRNNNEKLNELINSVFIIKGVVLVISFSVLLFLTHNVKLFVEESNLFLLTFCFGVYEFLFPVWYYQGTEQMKYITIVNLIGRVLYILLIVIIIKNSGQYLLVPVLNSITAIISALIAMRVMVIKEKFKFTIPCKRTILSLIKGSNPLLISNLIIAVKDKFNYLFIGSALGMREIAIYDLAVKILNLSLSPINIVNNTIFPHIAKQNDLKFAKKMLAIMVLGTFVYSIIIQIFILFIVQVLGNELTEAILPARVFMVVPVIMAVSQTIARNFLIVKGRNRIFLVGVVTTTVFYLALLYGVQVFEIEKVVMTYVIISILVFIYELLYRLIAVKKLKLL